MPLPYHYHTITQNFKTTSKPLQKHFKTTSKPLRYHYCTHCSRDAVTQASNVARSILSMPRSLALDGEQYCPFSLLPIPNIEGVSGNSVEEEKMSLPVQGPVPYGVVQWQQNVKFVPLPCHYRTTTIPQHKTSKPLQKHFKTTSKPLQNHYGTTTVLTAVEMLLLKPQVSPGAFWVCPGR